MIRSSAPHVLITGTSGAIGGAIATAVRAKYSQSRLTLVDKHNGPSESLAGSLGGRVSVRTIDLGVLDALPGLIENAESEHGAVDVLVNCAGFMDVRRLDTTDWALAQNLMFVDLLSPLRLMQLCATAMSTRGAGVIVNIASMAARVPLKGCVYYCAAKAGLAAASEIARAELAPRGVQVVTVYPGPVASALESGARAQYPDGFLRRAMPVGTPDKLASAILHGIERGHARVIYPSVYALGYLAVDLATGFSLGYGPDPVA